MVCKNCKIRPVWKFTNQTQLCRNCFIDYFERKVFRTIRKDKMLFKGKIIRLKKDSTLNAQVLKFVLEKKFPVIFGGKPNFSFDNLSQAAEEIFSNILKGKFEGPKPNNKPLYFLSDKEVELYAKLKGIKGKTRKHNKEIQQLFGRFTAKNPDLEHNIVNALGQISLKKTSAL